MTGGTGCGLECGEPNFSIVLKCYICSYMCIYIYIIHIFIVFFLEFKVFLFEMCSFGYSEIFLINVNDEFFEFSISQRIFEKHEPHQVGYVVDAHLK